MKPAPDKSHFFLTRVKFVGHIIQRNISPRLQCKYAVKITNQSQIL